MQPCLVTYFYDNKTNRQMWSCNKGLTRSTHPATSERCWRYNCPGINKKCKPEIKICNYIYCQKPVRNAVKAKYCSLKCKSKESSRKYRLKQKQTS